MCYLKFRYIIILFIVLFMIAAGGNFVLADAFVYSDDFETDKAKYDSWRHSPFVETIPDIFLYGLLHYEDWGMSGRSLGFYGGWEVGGDAYLAYATIPQKAFPSAGSVGFYILGPGIMRIYGSTNGFDWSLLGSCPGTIMWQYFSLSISEADPVHFLEFVAGESIMDDLQITIDYISPNLLLIAPNGGESLVAGSIYIISWESQGLIDNVNIEFSINDGDDWTMVDPPNTGNTGSYNWLMPLVDSNQCLVRICDATDPNIKDTSDEMFTIFECQGPIFGDLNNDCYVDFKDFAILAGNWLDCGNPFDPNCGIQ